MVLTNKEGAKKYRVFPSVRAVVFVLVLVGCIARQAGNNVLNFSIACMVNSSLYLEPGGQSFNQSSANSSSSTTPCGGEAGIIHDDFHGHIAWDRDTQSNVLAALSWGSTVFIFFGGWICDRFGVKKLYVAVMALLAVTSFLIPVAAEHSWIGVFVLRLLQGISMVAGWPVVMVVSNEWFAVSEIGLMQSLSTSGSQFGAIISMLVSGAFCQSVGWEAIFYLFGSLAGVTSLALVFLYFENVEKCPFISTEEREYIQSTRRVSKSTGSTNVPWRSIFTSVPVWAIFLNNFFSMYLFYFIGQFAPTYYKEVLGFDPASSGLYAALPFVAQLVGRNIAGVLIGVAEGRMSRTIFVKISAAISGYGPPVCLLCATLVDCHDPGYVVALFTLAYFFIAWILGGYILSTQSIAPQFAATISGFSQTAMFASGVLCPYVTGAVTKHSTPDEWKIAIYIAAGFSFVGSTIFVLFGSGMLQPWATTAAESRVTPVTIELDRVEDGAEDGVEAGVEDEEPRRRRSSFFLPESVQFACERDRLPSFTENF